MVNSKNPTSDCFVHQKNVLNCFGLLYNQNVVLKVYTISLIILLNIYLLSVWPEIVKEFYADLTEFILIAELEIAQSACLLIMCVIFWNRFELKLLLEKLQLLDELANFNNAEGEIVLVKQYKDIVRKQVYIGLSWITLLQISFISMSVMESLTEEKWILPFGCRSTIITNDNIQYIIQVIVAGIVLTVGYAILITYINVLTLICGHCKLLQKYIALSFTDYQEEIFKELDVKLIEKKIPDWKSFKVQLQNIVPYHVGIIDTANQMETVFSSVSFIFFGTVILCLCLVIYHTQITIEISETVQDVFMIISGYLLLFVMSIYGENVATESSKIASACYELDFVGCDLRIQKSLIIIMAIAQRPITPTVGKLTDLGLRTMLSILQSIYSYYTILRNLMNE